MEGDRLLVGCGQGTAIELLELQLEGKKRTSACGLHARLSPAAGREDSAPRQHKFSSAQAASVILASIE